MGGDRSFQELMARLRAGDAEAAGAIFRQFAGRLVGLARSHLVPALRAKEDPEDVVQSVFRSFFARHARGQFQLPDPDSLWNLLAVITLRKCGHRVGHYLAACRDVRRESAPPDAEDPAASWQAIARDPTPSEAAVLVETVQGLTRELGERDRRVLELSLRGEAVPQISQELGCSERTVERALERVRRRLEELSSPGPA